jgi:hypothetical protein
MNTSEIESLIVRVEQLESANQRLEQQNLQLAQACEKVSRDQQKSRRFVWFVLFGALGTVIIGRGIGAAGPRIIEAEEFRLRDKSGNRRAFLGTLSDDLVALELYGSGGGRIVQVAAGSDGTSAGLCVCDQQGNLRSFFGRSLDGHPGLCLLDRRGNNRATLATSPGYPVGLGVYDSDGKMRTLLGVGLSGDAGCSIFDKEGQLRSIQMMQSDGEAGFSVLDRTGKVRAQTVVDKADFPRIEVTGQDGKPLFRAP